ncbi:1,3-beta-galactosyl-N-acetylhexosamine phosphorylase [Butyrivibrio sp. YAB3001]|uniref:1,3-beta-galactosyl-N-acetylhexosamine phosphorylase n=1 Tax=Butyrivibrio sp. YAB3001 TaxID=1520812 RepID=UPI0008F6646C|nr:1,3-beta-galactosyl-N-acetylhexosamine phosphorylase [Butyrivibrio sp. YAB3001]SFD10155.1 beta-D-galactosyl-(1->4)-L-rhamnose phosphorylase [Butyrivibrio sp. YAB3001]
MDSNKCGGGFTLPGESGYEKLTLELAEKWGADMIRDSDGTSLSDEILNSGYGIYSTICIIRDHNDWAKENTDKLQQTFLMTQPKVATEEYITFHLLDDFFEQQFQINDSPESIKYWQVFDRTTGREISSNFWTFEKEAGNVIVNNVTPWHRYTVSFMAYRIWEEISMYNHTTNNWDKEHLMPIDPVHPKTQEYMITWLKKWCDEHPATTVVRFTSMFYNFVWMWGSSKRNRNLFTDWGSYDFTVSPLMLDNFAQKYGYKLTAEDFINKGAFHVTHMPPSKKQLDYMDFINEFVVTFGRKLIDIVHSYNKKAYVFYDDSWIGIEPYSNRFEDFEFDGLIKCVFSGYEVRLCAGAKVKTHEIRLHPYLFPVGLGGLPTFAPGGNPTRDAKEYWMHTRRALLRSKIDRIGLGGYLHLVQKYPDFIDYIAKISNEFRTIRDLHSEGEPAKLDMKIAVLHSWGKIRSWTLSGHFHETYMNDLIHVNEGLSGFPIDVDFIDFDDLLQEDISKYKVIINAGIAGSAWSGGDNWNNPAIEEVLTKWVYNGGSFIGINEPSAVEGHDTVFRMSSVLGVDKNTIEKICHGKWTYEIEHVERLIPNGTIIPQKCKVHLTDGKAHVLLDNNKEPVFTVNNFGKGKGIYLSSFETNTVNNRFLLNLLLFASDMPLDQPFLTDNIYTECAYFPTSKKLIVINNSSEKQSVTVKLNSGSVTIKNLAPFDTVIKKI